MTRFQLEHGIRAACNLLQTKEVYIVGSQSILATYPDISGPTAKSHEMDILPILQTEAEADYETQQKAADILNGNIGEGTSFLSTHGFEVEGVVENDLSLPSGWRDRTIPVCNENTNGCTGHCLEVYDMAAAKLAAGRDKDRIAIINLIRQGIIKPEKLRDRVRLLEESQIFDGSKVDDLIARLKRWKDIASPPRRKPDDMPPI